MSFSLQCPACGASYELDESYLGQKVQCAECKEKFLIESGEGRIVARRESEPVEPVPAETQVAAEWKDGDVILDLYEVKQTHEGGGMGLVYRVHHRGWNMDLAVKSPRVGWFQTEEQKENFTRECEAWINLGLHPHIVSCYYVRTLGGIPRVFAEYVEGGSLKDWIDSRRLYEGGPQAALARILDIAIQFAWGLQYAHEQGLVHQDVKPANVLMTLDGTAKVSDFGLAKARVAAGEHFIAEGERSILVSTGGMTPAYCSPEQARGLPVSRRTDVWSWAVSVLEMFVGEVCWQSGLAAPEVLANLAEMRLKSAGIPEPSGTIVALLRLCLAEDPGKRPENFRVLVALFKATWRTLTGHEYVRDRPVPAKLHASVLNNQAVSLLDLGRFEDALSLFDEALGLDPGHPHVIYNRGLHLWRNSGLTDDRIVSALKESGLSRTDDWNLRYLLGWIHSERGDFESAVENFSSALGMRGPKAEILRALAEARARTNCALSEHNALEESFSVFSVALSVDGRWALLANLDCSLRLWDIRSGRCIQTLRGHESPAFSLTFSMDRRMAVSGSGDGTVRL